MTRGVSAQHILLALGTVALACADDPAKSPIPPLGAEKPALESERVGSFKIHQSLDSAVLEGTIIADAVRVQPIGGDSARVVRVVLRTDTIDIVVHGGRVGSIVTRSPHVRSIGDLGVGTAASVFSRELLREAAVIHGDLYISPASLCGVAFVIPNVAGETGDAVSSAQLASLPSSARVVEIVVNPCV